MSESDNRYFQSALSDFTFDVACGGAIRHLADLGYSAEEIKERLDYPTSLSNVKNALRKYEEEKKALSEGKPKMKIVKEYDEYGRSSFRQVKVDEDN